MLTLTEIQWLGPTHCHWRRMWRPLAAEKLLSDCWCGNVNGTIPSWSLSGVTIDSIHITNVNNRPLFFIIINDNKWSKNFDKRLHCRLVTSSEFFQSWSPFNTWFLGPTWVRPLNNFLIGSAVFAQFTRPNTSTHTDHATGWLVAWHSGRTLVFGRRTFPVRCSTCCWRVTIYVDKPSFIGQLTRPPKPFIHLGSINE